MPFSPLLSKLVALVRLAHHCLYGNKLEHSCGAISLLMTGSLNGVEEAIAPIIDSYLPSLVVIVKHAPSYRKVAADLVAQCFCLKTILAWHVKGLTLAETYSQQALYYSEIAHSTNLQLTALNQQALLANYARQFPQALTKSEAALALL